jgi:carbamoyl-phosphate synthase large subunit
MGVGRTFGEAFAKGQLAAGDVIPKSGLAFISVRHEDKNDAVIVAKELVALGFTLCATHGTARSIKESGLECKGVNKVREGQPHIVDMLKNDEIDIIVNTTEDKQAIADSYSIRRTALQHKVFYTTTMAGAMATILALKNNEPGQVNRLQDLHKEISIKRQA